MRGPGVLRLVPAHKQALNLSAINSATSSYEGPPTPTELIFHFQFWKGALYRVLNFPSISDAKI